MLKTFDVNLDIEKDLYTASEILFSVSRNDLESIQLLFTITQDNLRLNLTGTTVELAIKKPSGLTVYQECTITDSIAGEAEVLLSLQAYLEYGVHTAEVYIRDIDQLAVTCPFYFASREAIMTEDTQNVESINDWTDLHEALFAYDKKPLVISGVPTTVPEYIGQMAFDTTGLRAFIANATTAEGWQLLAAGEGGGGIVYWADILAKPETFTPAAHSHTSADITDFLTAVGAAIPAEYLTVTEGDARYALAGETGTGGGTWGTITGILADQTDLQTALNGKVDDADLAGYSPTGHTHTAANITDFGTAVAANIPAEYLTTTEANAAYQAINTVPAHTHTAANITDFGTAVAANIPAEYLTQTEGDARYLTEVPAEYLTETEGDAKYSRQPSTGTGDPTGAPLYIGQIYVNTTTGEAWIANSMAGNWQTISADEAGTGGAGEAVVEDNLTSTSTTNALSANQGRILNTIKADTDHTHTAANITDFGTAVAANIPAEYLTTTEANAAYQAINTVPAHDHAIANITGLTDALAGKADDADLTAKQDKATTLTAAPATAPAYTGQIAIDTTNKNSYIAEGTTVADWKKIIDETDLATKSDTDHVHTAANITDFGTAVAAAIPAEYLTATEGDAAYQAKGVVPSHDHTAANITDFGTAVAANIPAEYLTTTEADAAYQAKDTVAAHTHTAANITDFGTAVAANIPAEYLTTTEGNAAYQAKDTVPAHTHTSANITDFGTAVAANVPLMSGSVKGGAMVGNGLAMSTNYLFVKTTSTDGTKINTTNNSVAIDRAVVDTWYAPATHTHGDKQDKATTTAAAPTAVPAYIGQMNVDTTNKRTYIAEGTTAADWRRLAGTNYVDAGDNYIEDTVLAGLSLWQGTQAEYDAIATKSATTLYFIKGA